MRTVLIIVGVVTVLVGIGAGALYFYAEMITAQKQLDVKAADRAADVRILFIGNSFTNYHDMHIMTEQLLEQAVPEWDDALVMRHAPDGKRLYEHADEMNQDGKPLNQALLSGSPTLRDWDYVILQEQSQILGFGAGNASYESSNEAAYALANAAYSNGSRVVLLMTWGYATGDDSNPGQYPDFLTMQDRITAGYDQLALNLTGRGIPTTVIPVGVGFRYTYLEIQSIRGTDPMNEQLEFRRLYEPDNYHPSVAGSYMTACMTVAAITGRRVSPLTYRPDGLSAEYAAYIRNAADAVVFDGRMGVRTYPYQQP